MQQRSCSHHSRREPGHRPLILVEDDSLDLTTLDLTPHCGDAFDIVVCSGPTGDLDVCPLVMSGTCPVGVPDVVVSALGATNHWRSSVARAWECDGVPVVRVDPGEGLEWPEHIGVAVHRLTHSSFMV